MEFFKTLSSAIETGTEQFNAAEDRAYQYADSKVTEYKDDTKTLINELDEGASYLNTKIRDGADEFIDETAERNQEFYTEMKDEVKEKVVNVAVIVGMEETGAAINEKIDSGAEVIQSAGEAVTTKAHEKVKNIGTLNRERKMANAILDKISTSNIENPTMRQIAGAVKSGVQNVVNAKLTDVPATLAKTGVDVVALTAQTAIATRDPFPAPDELEIGQTKTIAVDLKFQAHLGIGGGVTEARQFTTERLGEDEYLVTFTFDASAKVGIGESAGEGVDANVGLEVGTKVSVRGSAKMLGALKAHYKKTGTLNMINLQKMSPDEIRVGGEVGNFVDGSLLSVASNKIGTGFGVEAVWTKKEGLHTELSAHAKVSPQIGLGFAANLPGDIADIPNLAASFELKGTLKTDGKLELKATAQVANGDGTINAEGTISVDLNKLGLTKEEALALIEKGDFNPNDFGAKFDFKVYTSKVIDGGISLDTPIGGIKNQITEKKVYAKPLNVLQHANLRL